MTRNRLKPYLQGALKGTGVLVTAKPPVRNRTRAQALRCALRGLKESWMSQPNFRLHIYFGACVVTLGLCLRLAVMEWLWISFAIGLVLFAELVNTTIEQTVDLVVGLGPDPLARRIKDVSASCVLVAACLAVVIGCLTFIPHLLRT